MTEDFELMKSFYQNVLQQQIEFDFGNSIGFKNGVEVFLKMEEEKWECPVCGFRLSVHRDFCINCKTVINKNAW